MHVVGFKVLLTPSETEKASMFYMHVVGFKVIWSPWA